MVTTVRLSAEVDSKLTMLAKETGRTKSYYIRELIEENIEDLVTKYEILKDVEDYRAGKLETMSLEEIEKKHYEMED